MPIKIRLNSFSGQLLVYLFAAEELITEAVTYRPRPYGSISKYKNLRANRSTLYRLVKSGLIEIIEREGKEYFKLTKTGQMQALMLKARLPRVVKWDGKWRMVIFDIPEKSKSERNQLRSLLLNNNFFKLQASVYISPYAINREAIKYLKDTGLFAYIRFARIDELDDDKELRKKFNL